MRRVATAIVAVVLGLSWLATGIGSSRPMPDNAQLILDTVTPTYFAPPCLASAPLYVKHVGIAGSSRDASELKYQPDPACRDAGGFVQEDRSLFGLVLVAIGVLKPLPSRWNGDGSWNW